MFYLQSYFLQSIPHGQECDVLKKKKSDPITQFTESILTWWVWSFPRKKKLNLFYKLEFCINLLEQNSKLINVIWTIFLHKKQVCCDLNSFSFSIPNLYLCLQLLCWCRVYVLVITLPARHVLYTLLYLVLNYTLRLSLGDISRECLLIPKEYYGHHLIILEAYFCLWTFTKIFYISLAGNFLKCPRNQGKIPDTF